MNIAPVKPSNLYMTALGFSGFQVLAYSSSKKRKIARRQRGSGVKALTPAPQERC